MPNDIDDILSDMRLANEQLLLAGLRAQGSNDALRDQLAETHAITNSLEDQVLMHTRELTHTNTLLQAEIKERTRVEAVRLHLIQQLVTAQEEERRRIARELHDQMGQTIAALMLSISILQEQLGDVSPLQQHVATLHVLGNQLNHDVRTLAVQLRPPALDDFGLLPTLITFIEQWSSQADVAADFYSTGMEDVRLSPAMETTIFRIIQEALTNITRHAHATTVSVLLHYDDEVNTVHLIVEDNGGGYDVEAENERPYGERRFGILGMQERVAQLAGTLIVESALDSGTAVFVSLPNVATTERKQ